MERMLMSENGELLYPQNMAVPVHEALQWWPLELLTNKLLIKCIHFLK